MSIYRRRLVSAERIYFIFQLKPRWSRVFIVKQRNKMLVDPLPLNTANDVRRSENKGEGNEVTEQNPGEKNVGQFTARCTHHRCVVVLQKHPTDEQSYLSIAKYFLKFVLLESKLEFHWIVALWVISQLQQRYCTSLYILRGGKNEILTFAVWIIN